MEVSKSFVADPYETGTRPKSTRIPTDLVMKGGSSRPLVLPKSCADVAIWVSCAAIAAKPEGHRPVKGCIAGRTSRAGSQARYGMLEVQLIDRLLCRAYLSKYAKTDAESILLVSRLMLACIEC